MISSIEDMPTAYDLQVQALKGPLQETLPVGRVELDMLGALRGYDSCVENGIKTMQDLDRLKQNPDNNAPHIHEWSMLCAKLNQNPQLDQAHLQVRDGLTKILIEGNGQAYALSKSPNTHPKQVMEYLQTSILNVENLNRVRGVGECSSLVEYIAPMLKYTLSPRLAIAQAKGYYEQVLKRVDSLNWIVTNSDAYSEPDRQIGDLFTLAVGLANAQAPIEAGVDFGTQLHTNLIASSRLVYGRVVDCFKIPQKSSHSNLVFLRDAINPVPPQETPAQRERRKQRAKVKRLFEN